MALEVNRLNLNTCASAMQMLKYCMINEFLELKINQLWPLLLIALAIRE